MSETPQAPPFRTAASIAQEHGLDQVVIIGRKTGDGGFETITTWGRSDDDARVCDMIGVRITRDIMQWETADRDEIAERVALGRLAPELKRQRDRLMGVMTGVRAALWAVQESPFWDEDSKEAVRPLYEEVIAVISECRE